MRILLFSVCLLIGLTAKSQEFVGVNFIKENLSLAKTKATSKDKLIFVDAYTTWCGPCKMMDRKTFKDPTVVEFYNDNFINLKMDMEKGIGPVFAQKHGVRGYPSLLFINAAGELVHRSLGFQDSNRFLELGQAAIDPNKQVVTLQKRFEAGEKDQEFLLNFADALTLAGMEGYEEATQAYLDQEEDWSTSKNINVLFDYSEASIDSKLFAYMIKNIAKFESVVGAQKVADKIIFAASSDVRKKQVDPKDKVALKKHFIQYFGSERANEEATAYYLNNLMYAPGGVNEQKYLTDIQLFMATNPQLSSQSLNAHAWRIYELSEDRLLLSQANNWIDKSVALKKNSYNMDTKASILYKLGSKIEAIAAAKESIKLAQEEGNDPTATMQMLKKIMDL